MSVFTAVIIAMLTNVIGFVSGFLFCVYGATVADEKKCRECKDRRGNNE